MHDPWSAPTVPDAPPPAPGDAAVGPSPVLLLHVWLHPRRTVRTVLDHGASYLVVPLVLISGWAPLRALQDDNANLTLVVALFVLLPFVGVFGTFARAWLISTVGGWFGARRSEFGDIVAAVAWGYVPVTAPAALTPLVYVALYAGGGPAELYTVFVLAWLGVNALLWAWCFITLIAALGEVLRVGNGVATLVYLISTTLYWVGMIGAIIACGLLVARLFGG